MINPTTTLGEIARDPDKTAAIRAAVRDWYIQRIVDRIALRIAAIRAATVVR